ncbi:MAG TPA: hypothetical protein VF743_00890, partial [Acidimicrobiales bacterium]
MRHLTTSATVDAETAARLARPRDDIVGERAEGPGRFTQAHGPFARYERTVVVEPLDGADAAD